MKGIVIVNINLLSLYPHNLAWTESNLPGLKGIKAIDNLSVHIRDGSRKVRY